ncbi:MAG: GGDEF domain-containing protein [Betaproteobacteria bacterium HGW-Betaproteobacteria-10]|nr:MAG: GGDEF domain-containing protein [Betaproteobacteria bacterium HGW-Betaproteobacteria-10]
MTAGVRGKHLAQADDGDRCIARGAYGSAGEREAQFLDTMEAAQVGIFVLQDCLFRYANSFLLNLFGYTADQFINKLGPLDLVSPDQHTMLLQMMDARSAGLSGMRYELAAIRRDGSAFPITIQGSPSIFNGKPASVGTVLDISAQKAAELKIRELADFDILTGLPNRRLLRDRVTQLLAIAEREQSAMTLMFLDLDHFKRVNDSLGHSVGDELLCAVAERLSASVRRIDTLARLGGDEFILAMPGIQVAGAVEVARRLVAACGVHFLIAGHDLTVTPSIGISIYPQDGKDIETLLKHADVAMYKAKEQGRNTFQFYAAEMNQATLDRLLMESNLRRALKQQEFVLHYQPLVSLQSGLIIGVEALIRWQHADLGLIMPDHFIRVAEETGLINQIGDWVLSQACHQAQSWIDAGLPPMVMAVNVSPVQFRQLGFVDAVAGALAASGLAAERLELEVTEGTVMHDADINLGTLSALHRMGVELSVDDFGTGYSSLSYLKRFPVNKLKIDRSFVRDLEVDADDRAIASTIVSMGRNLRLTVLAEGVETAGQLALLRQMGCDMAQGYYFSRPLVAAEMTELLRTQPFLNQE